MTKRFQKNAFLPDTIGRALVERLQQISIHPKEIALLSSQTGIPKATLTQQYPKASITSLDLSFPPTAKQNIGPQGQFEERCASAPYKNDHFELVFANLPIEWIVNLKSAFEEIYRLLKEDGLFLFSLLGPDTLTELRQSLEGLPLQSAIPNPQSEILPHPPIFPDMHNVGDLLVHTGFKNVVMDKTVYTFTYADFRLLLKDAKTLTLPQIKGRNAKGLLTPRRLQQLEKAYQPFKTEQGEFIVTVEMMVGCGWKKFLSASTSNADVRSPVQLIRRGPLR